MSLLDGISRVDLGNADLLRFAPEPRSRSVFGSVMNGVRTAIGAFSGGLDGVIDPTYIELINKQIETQFQMQVVSFESNVEKSRHETEMAPIRNIRVG